MDYQTELQQIIAAFPDWEAFHGKRILVTGATGLIGSYVTDLFMARTLAGYEINVVAMGRNRARAQQRFAKYWSNPHFSFLEQDVTEPVEMQSRCDFIIHAASNAHPRAYATDPVGTLHGNYMGMYRLLEFARRTGTQRVLFVSSGEVYGNLPDAPDFTEDMLGRDDPLDVRSCYPLGKKAAECLACCYHAQYGLPTVIARLSHTYGPTQTKEDSRAIAQFLRNAKAGEDIVLKSRGEQVRNYCYVADAVLGLLFILVRGNPAEAYNVSDPDAVISIADLAGQIAKQAGTKVRFELADQVEQRGYTKIPRGVLCADKLRSLGWRAQVGLKEGIARSIGFQL